MATTRPEPATPNGLVPAEKKKQLAAAAKSVYEDVSAELGATKDDLS